MLSPYKAPSVKIPLKYSYWASKTCETACYCRKLPKQAWNDWKVLALLAANRLRRLGSKIRKRQIVHNANADLRPDFHYHPLNLNATFRTRSMNSCYHATKLTLPKFHSNIFTEPPKYVKLHVIAENRQNSPEMTEQCSRCSLPTGLEDWDKKSENVKSCAMPMPTYDPIFLIIRWIKTQLLEQEAWTRVIALQSSLCQNSTQIFLLSLQNTWNCMLLQKIAKTALKWLNSARVARCQQAQKPRIKNPKTSNRAQRRCRPTTQFSLSYVELKRNF